MKRERDNANQRRERKEELVDNMQARLTQVLKENGEYHREIAVKSEELERLKNKARDDDKLITELKAQLKENERALAEFHSKA